MVSSNINRVGRIAEADIHALTVTSEKDERNTQPLFKIEPDTKPNKISIDLNLNLIFCRGCFMMRDFIKLHVSFGDTLTLSLNITFLLKVGFHLISWSIVILDVTSGDTLIKFLAIVQLMGKDDLQI